MRLLDIYLDDHWAGAGAGENLASRLAVNNASTSWAQALDDVAREVAEDDRTLQEIRDRLGVTGGTVKRAIAQIGERLSRLKLNGRLIGYSPLSRVVEAEALIAGISAKRLLWTALATIATDDPVLAGYDFAALEQRADEQLTVLRKFHREAAESALPPGRDDDRR